MSDDETLRVYARKAQEYANLTAAQDDPLLKTFINALPKAAQILDLGCGPGDAARQMAEAGLNVTATDAVPEMVALANAHDGVNAKCARFEDIRGINLFDGIWANFSLLHAPRQDMPRHLAALKSALKPTGLFHIALKSGSGHTRDALGRLYTYYTEAELTGLLSDAGFHVKDHTTGRDLGLDGTYANWIALRAYG
jgi:SAM-dependent methyltransferase